MLKAYVAPLFTLLFLCFNYTYSQSDLSGKLLSNNEPVAFANVILLNAEDSTSVYKGAVSNEDGMFLLQDVEDNDYLLKVSFIGYQEFSRRITVNGNTRLEPIQLKENLDNLDEVTVRARRPKVTRSVDRITFNVENSTLSTGNTFDILKRTPGVIVSQGQLMVKNRPATVYINDRKVYLSSQELQQLLEGFSGGNIKSIEVITNPPARYDAEGGAILNIQTSKNISIGYKGSVNASNTIAIVPKYNVGTSQYYKNDWLNAFASYNFNSRFDYKNDDSRIEFYEPDGAVDSRWYTDFERNTRRISHSLNTILDFTLSDISSLNFSANIQVTPRSDSDIDGLTEIYNQQQQLDSLFTTDSRLENDQDNILLSSTYNTSIGEKGATLSAVVNYIYYNDDQTQDLMTRYLSPQGNLLNNNSFYTISGQNSNIYTGRIDLSTPWGSTSFETGLKYSGLKSDSGLDFFDTNSGAANFVQGLSDEFNYDENIYAAYASISKDWEKWSIKGGLRGEYTDIEGISNSLGAVNTQEYFQLFPTFYLMYNQSENNSFSVDYSRRIVRPRFQSLNPYLYFLNENIVNEGNPNLRPSISNKINFNYTYKNQLSFDLYWDRIDNATAVLPFQDNEEHVLRSVNANMNYEQQYSLDVMYYGYPKDWWYMYLYSSLYYMENEFIAYESGNQEVNNDVFSTYIQMFNQFTLSKDGTFIGDLTATYNPDFIAGSYTYDEPQYGLDIGLRKTFFDSRLTVTINAEDIFNTMNIPLTSDYLNQNYTFFAKPESRQVRFGLIYKFGNFKLRDNKRAIDAEESIRLEEESAL
ncbi:outer membrane beta-barrel family protein [Zunongwangia sp. F363]|uniref:Outer membrane beta-barrel family protein n=1 Tax=Autumnicola tepida TaxID=3075595 RepID=A0ABU3C938_9FLAO|nr:outer membrane beta-barrel family protein [Zunongwangia sp. F363]MDT0642732.1 outer membrane beta-barrel family protein [Zunongwangia sp. F363]